MDEGVLFRTNENAFVQTKRKLLNECKARSYDIKAVNPNRKSDEDTRTPEELIAIIEEQQAEIAEAIRKLKEKGI